MQSFELSFGKAHVFYPEASATRCTAALMLEVDPIGLVRGKTAGEPRVVDQYVNDRPYAASSFLSVALSRVFGSALSGNSKERPALATQAIPLEALIAVVPCRGGEEFLRRLFEPLGYVVTVQATPLDAEMPEWGASRYFTVGLSATKTLSELLSHLYVLIPVLDNDKHYWVGDDEVEKLLRHGEGWLAQHPERESIARRYLKNQKGLAREALARLMVADDRVPTEPEAAEHALEAKVTLNDQRLQAVVTAVLESGATRVLDLGCGEGTLLRALLKERTLTRIVGMDVSIRSLEHAKERLDRLSELQRKRVELIHGSLSYRDKRLAGFDAATIIEVIEHLDPPRLTAFERVVFEFARPAAVILTTPNVEFNVTFENLPPGTLRHRDHRFEWTRAQFEAWAGGVAARFGYAVRFVPVGPVDPVLGAPTQMAVFTR